MYKHWRWLWEYYRPYKYVLAVLVLLTPLQAALHSILPSLVGYAIDAVRTGDTPTGWIGRQIVDAGKALGLPLIDTFGVAFLVLGVVSILIYAFVQSHRAWMNCRLEYHFRQTGFDQITTKGPNFFNRFRSGDVITRLTDDVAEKLSWFACSGIFRFYEALMFVVFIIAMMLQIDPWLTLITVGPLPFVVIIFMQTGTRLDARYDTLQARISRFQDLMEAVFSGIRVVKSYNREPSSRDRFEETARDRRRAEISAVKITQLVDAMYGYIWQFGLVIVLIGAAVMIGSRNLTIGDLSSFLYYVMWLVWPMFDIGQFLVKSRQAGVSINRLREMESVPAQVADTGTATRPSTGGALLAFDAVSLNLGTSERPVLDNVSFTVDPGRTVAIVGTVGAGKTWLINLIPRLVDPSSGVVRLNERNLNEYSLAELRSIIGYVPQEPVLFSDTVRNNIVLGRDEIADATIEWAISIAQLKDEIARFPNGLETQIGTRGVSISGGQKQRLSLARALAGKPKLLVLDDCTSALDSRTEAMLWDRLHDVLPDMTAVVITHRPDTLERADYIHVLDAGRLVESGQHEDLMAAGGTYARVYKRYQLAETVGAKPAG